MYSNTLFRAGNNNIIVIATTKQIVSLYGNGDDKASLKLKEISLKKKSRYNCNKYKQRKQTIINYCRKRQQRYHFQQQPIH